MYSTSDPHLDHLHEWVVTALQELDTDVLEDCTNTVRGPPLVWQVFGASPLLRGTTRSLLCVVGVVVHTCQPPMIDSVSS